MGPFDEELFSLKMREPTRRMQEETQKALSRVRGETHQKGNSAYFAPAFVKAAVEILKGYLEEVDKTCRDVWISDGNAVTPEFIRDVLVPHISQCVASRKGALKHQLERTDRMPSSIARGDRIVIHGLNEVQQEVANRYRIEEIELRKRCAQTKIPKPRTLPPPVIPVHTGCSTVQVEAGSPGGMPVIQLAENSVLWTERREHNLRSWLVEHGIAPTPEALASFAREGGQLAHGAESNSASRVIGNAREGQERPNSWRSFHNRFMEFAREEQGRADVVTKGRVLQAMKVLRIHGDYHMHPEVWLNRENPEQRNFCLLNTPPHGVWGLYDGILSENFLERVRVCVSEAGRFLPDYPKGADSEDFWLHRLYFDLMKNKSDLLFCASAQGGMILSICIASATFCSRLQRRFAPELESRDAANAESRSLIGRNIDNLRIECGWSFDKLAEKTGIDKKLILAHVNKGTKPVPRIRKEYAQAFSEELKRKITAVDLEK